MAFRVLINAPPTELLNWMSNRHYSSFTFIDGSRHILNTNFLELEKSHETRIDRRFICFVLLFSSVNRKIQNLNKILFANAPIKNLINEILVIFNWKSKEQKRKNVGRHQRWGKLILVCVWYWLLTWQLNALLFMHLLCAVVMYKV